MTVTVIPVKAPVKSLTWQGDRLVDVAGGGRGWDADGTEHGGHQFWGYPFDAVTASASGRYSVVYGERDVKGVLMEGQRFVRELNRSCYLARRFDHTVAVGELGDGREVVAYCPEAYNVLHIEDAASGERLTAGPRTPLDVFHSRLSLSPGGRYLLSVGWYWQPIGTAMVFDTALALTDASTLDGDGLLPMTTVSNGEVTGGCWLDADRLVLVTGPQDWDDEQEAALPPRHIGVWSMSASRWLHRCPLAGDPGVLLLPRGDQVVSLHGHPRLVDAATGRVVAEWPEVGVSAKDVCYGGGAGSTPVAALHPDGGRLAVGVEGGIALVTLP